MSEYAGWSLPFLISAINGEQVDWPSKTTNETVREFLEFTSYHGVQALLFHQLKKVSSLHTWPTTLLENLQREVADQTVLEMLQQSELTRLFDVLAEADLFPLLMKGTPLSYTHYPFPILRPHLDIDLLIPAEREAQLKELITSLNYDRVHSIDGEFITHQETFKKQLSGGIEVFLDCHRKISNPESFAVLLTYKELIDKSVPVPPLGPHARTLCPQHALILACLHRVAHHSHERDRLIWLYDIHLLTEQMTPEEFRSFGRMVVEKQLRAVCYEGLVEAQNFFKTKILEDVIAGWNAHSTEPTAVYLKKNLRRFDLLRLDLARLQGLQNKIKLLRELLFPSRNYMMEKYCVSSRLLLPALYLHRAVAGTFKFFRRA